MTVVFLNQQGDFDPMQFKLARVSKGLSIRSLAEDIGYSAIWICLCERGKGKPSHRLIEAWKAGLGI